MQLELGAAVGMVAQQCLAFLVALLVGGGDGLAQIHAETGGRFDFVRADARAVVADAEDYAGAVLAAGQFDVRAGEAG